MSRRFRLALVGIVCLATAAAAVGYLVLVLSTAKAPPSAALSAAPSLHASGVTPATFQGAEGPWVVAPGGEGGFVGYRAREILGFDFIQSPNEAVARTTDVTGSISIEGTSLQTAEIKANVASLRSDIDVRDGHLHEFLLLDSHPDATFKLAAPVDIGTPAQGRVIKINASGDLTILDATKQVAFPLEARWNGDSIQIAGQLPIKRSDYNMDIPPASRLPRLGGDHARAPARPRAAVRRAVRDAGPLVAARIPLDSAVDPASERLSAV